MKIIITLTEENPNLKILAVTKGRSIEEIQKLLNNYPQIKAIGENRVSEAETKFPTLTKQAEKHFIGKLQSRKIPKIVELFDAVQSLESLNQAQALSKEAQKQHKNLIVFLQVNISQLPQRSGCMPEQAPTLIQEIQKLPQLELFGLMGMASQDPQKATEEFKLLKSLQGDLTECSMGMSSDHKIAISAGSTMLRLGRVLFNKAE